MKIAINDRAFLRYGQLPSDRLRELLSDAILADSLGFSRFWLAEHHGAHASHCAPEALLGAILAQTSRIRCGVAGMLMFFHRPWHVAEAFLALECLFPGRVDLGVAAGHGDDDALRQALAPGFDLETAHQSRLYARQVEELIALTAGPGRRQYWKRAQQPASYGFARNVATQSAAGPYPSERQGPPVIFLGGNGGKGNAILAAKNGHPLCFLVSRQFEAQSLDAVELYRDQFQASPRFREPQVLLAVPFVCAETENQVKALMATQGNCGPIDMPLVYGSPARCLDHLTRLQQRFGASEIVLSPQFHNHQARQDAYRMLAAEASLQ